ncbi:UDP-N-acetylmuramoyl-tripeptide--D-alanyl-D-alanine ligase [candidate division KSB1 bacterium]|nr:UDP-N-acetylmuramoyl-tripeptide--D-alanyl-D-alanine ligase [candidate division KSB1 bacterium]
MSLLTINDFETIKNSSIGKPENSENIRITGVSIDSRSIEPGNVFFAIRGERFDGHSFLPEVVQKGANAVVVSSGWIKPETPGWDDVIIVSVPDTGKALRELAGTYRRKFEIPIIGITGTNGKTTTKEMLFSVLSQSFKTYRSPGNFNNRYGLPLTLFGIDKGIEMAIVELGASYPGEIEMLCEIAAPTHGVITNIGRGHIEFFRSVEEVRQTKTALIRALHNKENGFINGDDERLLPYKEQYPELKTFGTEQGVDFRASGIKMQADGGFAFTIHAPAFLGNERLKVRMTWPGRINVYNALAAASVGFQLGMDKPSVLSGLESFSMPDGAMRMEITDWNGVIIINDCYNANPESMNTALDYLMEYPSTETGSRRFAVLGDMLELGETSKHEHTAVGKKAAEIGVDRLLSVGRDAQYMVEGAREAGLLESSYSGSHEEAAEILKNELNEGDVVLVKGSRGSTMEKVLNHLQREKAARNKN